MVDLETAAGDIMWGHHPSAAANTSQPFCGAGTLGFAGGYLHRRRDHQQFCWILHGNKKILGCEAGETLAQGMWRSCGCSSL